MIKRICLTFLASLCLTTILAASASAQTCTFTTSKKTITLNNDCTTTPSIGVPDGFTLDGAGHTITAVDPASDHFKGGVVQNQGASANVTNVKITTSGLANVVCDVGAD